MNRETPKKTKTKTTLNNNRHELIKNLKITN